ncbi:geminin coiled-coil domain-containing protein 1 [Salminus brasiliensis]|uniref:geminin coiled-coil domain-containing protein 1 n=1 Tax=Salminus brasiliensis TaxID=930266 RepID=UPI003B8337D6
MSAILSCQDANFAGGARYSCAYSASPPPRATVDVSKATLAPFWDAGALDNAGCQHEPPRRDALLPSAHAALHDSMWPEQLSPHLQRNKQLQDTLMQKEEELARLQEENNKLKEFLNSSYVKSLEEKSKRLLSDQRSSDTRQRKRTLNEEGDFLNLSRLLQGSEGKRVCRNLSLEFCSAEELATTPPLDSWILETLGLQDEDTIDPDSSFSSPTTDYTPSFNSPVPSTDHFSPAARDSTVCSPDANNHCEYGSVIDSSSSFNHSMDTSTEYSTLDPSPLYTVTSTGSMVSSLPAIVPTGLFTPPRAASTPQRLHSTSSGPLYNSHSSPSPAGGESVQFSTPRATRSRTDLAFSMSLSPQSSVKTHTFPQGQAFTRRDSQGGWNFTWVPKQCS